MKIIVSGCGKIGQSIIESLVSEGHDVVAIDKDPSVIEDISNVFDVMGVTGNGVDCEILKEAGVETARMFIAATGSDEGNMLSCFLAKKMGARHTIARIRQPEYNYSSLVFLRQQLDLSMAINPEMLAAQELYNILKFPTAVKIETFSRRDFEMIEMRLKPESVLDGLTLMQLREKYKARVLVCAVQRDDEVFIPDGNFVLKGGDRIGITATAAEIEKMFKALNIYQKQAKDVVILGGSRTAYYLSKMLSQAGSTVKVIDLDPDVCKRFSDDLPKVSIVQGDGSQQEMLLEAGIRETDAFVALTGIDEENILLSVSAQYMNVPKVIAKVNRDELFSIAGKLGLDSIISPKKVTTDVILRYARALDNSMGSNVETLYQLMDGKAEAIEFKVSPDFIMLGVPLKDMKIKKNVLIAGIIRERKPIIPVGDDVILPGDRVIVIAGDLKLHDLADIIRG